MLSALAVLSLALSAAAAPPNHHDVSRRQADDANSQQPLLLIGGGPSGTIAAANFDGTSFNIFANNTIPGTSASWLLFKQPNLVYAVDESSNNTRLFTFDPTQGANALTLVQNATGSSGVVFLEFNIDRSRMVGAAFGQGQIDVWDVSAADGTMTLMKQIVSNDPLGPNAARQEAPHPHQALLENSGRFFVVNDLGTDTILIIDSLDDAFEVVNRVRVPAAGCGPRHGAFFPRSGADFPTTYLVVCEMLSTIQVFSLEFSGGNLTMTPTQNISTFGPDSPPLNLTSATAGEIAVSDDNAHVYVSNRNTGNETDSISVFAVTGGASSSGAITISFRESISSGGKVPRMFSLSADADETKLYTANQAGDLGLVAIERSDDGSLALDTSTTASLAVNVFGADGFGPQFVKQIEIQTSTTTTSSDTSSA